MTHRSSTKLELRHAWPNTPFCVRVHVTQIIALWNRKKNPGQFKLMTWLLFLKWAGVYMKPLHAAPEQGEHPSVRLPESWPKGLAKASEGVWQGSTKGETRLHGLFHSLKTCIPFLLSFCMRFYQISFSSWIFCSSLFWKVCCKRLVLHLFLGHKCFWKIWSKACTVSEKNEHKTQNGAEILRSTDSPKPYRPPIKIPSKWSLMAFNEEKGQVF